MELKSLEDWVVEKSFKSVPDIVDVSSFGGPTREYQVRVDPNKLIAYGLSLAQVEQQLTNNNPNAGGSFIQEGLQQINVRAVGLVDRSQDIAETVIMTKNGTPLRVKDIAVVSQGPKIRLGQFARGAFSHRAKTERLSTTTMWSRASCCCAKARRRRRRSRASTKKWKN